MTQTETQPVVAIYCDGLCEPNPGGVATFGWTAQDEATGMIIARKGAQVTNAGEQTTNNLAEYCALESALKWLVKSLAHFKTHGRKHVVIRSDSQLVINQVSGKWACNADSLRSHRDSCRFLIKGIQMSEVSVSLEWIPRERNVWADEISREAYKAVTGHEPPTRQPRKKPISH